MLGHHADTVNSSLSNRRVLGTCVAANLLGNSEICWSKEIRSQELNHIIEDEKQELLLLLGSISLNSWEHSGLENLHKVSAVWSMSLEQDTDALGKGNLKLILALVLLLEDDKVFFIELIVFFSLTVFFFVFVVLLNSVLESLRAGGTSLYRRFAWLI